jgi:hypothetical protein
VTEQLVRPVRHCISIKPVFILGIPRRKIICAMGDRFTPNTTKSCTWQKRFYWVG